MIQKTLVYVIKDRQLETEFLISFWNCLTKRIELAKDSAAPVIEYSNQFSLPSDCLRVLKIHNGQRRIKSDMEYKIEGRKVKIKWTIFLVYIALDTDPNNYDTFLRSYCSSTGCWYCGN